LKFVGSFGFFMNLFKSLFCSWSLNLNISFQLLWFRKRRSFLILINWSFKTSVSIKECVSLCKAYCIFNMIMKFQISWHCIIKICYSIEPIKHSTNVFNFTDYFMAKGKSRTLVDELRIFGQTKTSLYSFSRKLGKEKKPVWPGVIE
jgi:hypothetical protein